MMHNGEEKEKTLVLWEMSSCPIPDGFDPLLVRRRIESALKNSGHSGPLTISAIDDLTKKIDADKEKDVLRKLSSTGIALRHADDVVDYLNDWEDQNLPPASIMLICDSSQLETLAGTLYRLKKEGYKILLAYPQRDPALDWLWKSFLHGVYKEWLWKSLLEGAADNNQETTRLVPDESPFYCEVCRFAGKSFESFTTHLKSVNHCFQDWDRVVCKTYVNRLELQPPPPPNNDHEFVKEWERLLAADRESRLPKHKEKDKCHKDEMMMPYEEKEEKTLVWWHINSCPIPEDVDPSLVGPRIVSALNNSPLSRSGPLTITAIGDLTNIPGGDNVLKQLSSSGIALKHAPHDDETELTKWTDCNPSFATIIFISGSSELQRLAPLLYELNEVTCRIFLAYPEGDPAPDWLLKSFLSGVPKEWYWEDLLKETVNSKQKTTRLALQDKWSEMGESAWSCSACQSAGQIFQDFTAHLKSQEHASCVEKFKKSKTEGEAKEEEDPDCEQDEEDVSEVLQ